MPSTEQLLQFLEANKTFLMGLTALNSAVNLVLILTGFIFIATKWRELSLVGIGPLQFQRKKITSDLTRFQISAGGTKTSTDTSRIERAVRRATEPAAADRLAGKMILWVDDHPENNLLGIRALARLGLHVERAMSTDEAMLHLDRYPDVDLIISDMGRGENMNAGYELLEQIRQRGIEVPFAIFAGSDTPEYRKVALDRGAQLSTNNVSELLNFITETLGS